MLKYTYCSKTYAALNFFSINISLRITMFKYENKCSKNVLNICEAINKPIYGKYISYFEFLDLLIYLSLLYSILTFPLLFA